MEIYPKELKVGTQRDINEYSHNGVIYNRPIMEDTHMSTDGWTNQQNGLLTAEYNSAFKRKSGNQFWYKKFYT